MSDTKKVTIKSVEHFLAHIHAMKCESEDRIQDLSDCLLQHNNTSAADIFSRAIFLIQESLQLIELDSKGLDLPNIPPWEYQWHCQQQGLEEPDSLCMEQAHYLMTAQQALDLAICNETRLELFCQQQSVSGINESIRILAQQLYLKERQLIVQMKSWSEFLDKSDGGCYEDFDPPNIPE